MTGQGPGERHRGLADFVMVSAVAGFGAPWAT